MTALDGKRKKRRGVPVRRRVTRRERQLEIAINNISPGVALFNAAGRLVLCNKRYIDMYNLSPDVVKPGCPLKELLRAPLPGRTACSRSRRSWLRAS